MISAFRHPCGQGQNYSPHRYVQQGKPSRHQNPSSQQPPHSVSL